MSDNRNLRGALLMALAMAGFAVNDAMVRLVAGHLNTGEIMLLRGAMTTVIIGLFAWRMKPTLTKDMMRDRCLILRTICEALAAIAYVHALSLLPLSNAASILQALPLVVTMGAAVFLGEKVGWRRWLAILVGFVGVVIILEPGFGVFSPWALVPLLSATMFAVYGLLTRYVARKDSAGVSFFYTGVVGAIAMTPFGLMHWVWMTPADWGWMFLLCCTAAGSHWLLIKAYAVAEASAIQPFAYLQIVWASAIGLYIFGETLRWNVALGAGIVVAAGIFTLWRQRVREKAALRQAQG